MGMVATCKEIPAKTSRKCFTNISNFGLLFCLTVPPLLWTSAQNSPSSADSRPDGYRTT